MKKIISIILIIFATNLLAQETTFEKLDIIDLANKYELVDGKVKSKLIGAKIHLSDGTKPVVEDYNCDYKTNTIVIKFVGIETASSFSFGTKFIVTLNENKLGIQKNAKQGKQKHNN